MFYAAGGSTGAVGSDGLPDGFDGSDEFDEFDGSDEPDGSVVFEESVRMILPFSNVPVYTLPVEPHLYVPVPVRRLFLNSPT